MGAALDGFSSFLVINTSFLAQVNIIASHVLHLLHLLILSSRFLSRDKDRYSHTVKATQQAENKVLRPKLKNWGL